MTFNSWEFAAFFAVFYPTYRWLARSRGAKVGCVVVGSLLFYAAWDVRFVALLLGLTSFDFLIARVIRAAPESPRRAWLLGAAIAGNLATLGYFKYLPVLSIAVPVGLSFYAFQGMSYLIDVYRGTIPPARKFLDFIASVAFFPHLLAGPIVRASQLLPQFETVRDPSREDTRQAVALFFIGLFKKTLADLVAIVVNQVFSADPHQLGTVGAWTGAIGFYVQLYGDFSGYTDMAIAIARSLGYTLPTNFNNPFAADSPIDFWRRWHITLGTWFRDYLYTPLAVWLARSGARSLAPAVLFTMMLVGLWHGPRVSYIAYGFYYGVLMLLTWALDHRFPGLSSERGPIQRAVRIVITTYLVIIGMVIARAPDLAQAFDMIRLMHVPTGSATPLAGSLFGWVVFAFGICCIAAKGFASETGNLRTQRYPWAVCGALAVFSVVFYSVMLELHADTHAFIYFFF